MLQSQEATLREKEQGEVQTVLLSMARSPLMGRLFSYVCQKYFDGLGSQLNEIRIAQEVFGRTESFDRSQDAIARVEAHRLRKKLKLYYQTDGRNHDVQIELPSGSYAPVFHHSDEKTGAAETVREAQAQSSLELGSSAALVATPSEPAFSIRPASIESTERAPATSTGLRWTIYAAIGLAIAVALLIGWQSQKKAETRGRADAGSTPKQAAMPLPAANFAPIRMLCGYDGPPHISRLGEVWSSDQYFHEGGPWPGPHHRFIRSASDPFLFENTRRGDFSYDIPAKPGTYELHLYFVETEYGEDLGGGENSRTFDILLNGAPLLSPFDPLADAGGPWIADERIFKDVQPASDGMVHLKFESRRGQPMISAIQLLPGIPHRQLPIRLATQVNSYTDHKGKIWAPDNYYIGGQLFGDKPVVSGTPDPMLYQTERAGNFRYVIPVDLRGVYSATLYFAETYFGPGASGVGGASSRLFNLMCNGVLLLDHFDVFAQAGSLKPIQKTFHGLKSNAQGKLMFWFEPIANYASVFGIEVLDESK